ncbi:hypothetical protein [Gimesia aquarii]|nr:hypothetical protein [Gimesia aquarii]
MVKTRDGIGFSSIIAKSRPSEYHHDQVLASLGQLEIPESTNIQLQNSMGSVKDVLKQSVARFHLKQKELEWSAIGFSCYLKKSGPYKNKYGESWCFDDLAKELLSRDFSEASCGGVHRLEALISIYFADKRHFLLSKNMRSRVKNMIVGKMTQAIKSQSPSGYWTIHWWRNDNSPAPPQSTAFANSDTGRLLATSHLAELLMRLPSDLVNQHEKRNSVERAANWLVPQLKDLTSEQIQATFCPCSHASAVVLSVSRPRSSPNTE